MEANRYSPLDKGERERLARQAHGYFRFDEAAIDEATEGKDGLTVLDMGCANGALTRSRFFDGKFYKVVGVDIDKTAIGEAQADDKFRFYALDLEGDFVQQFKQILCDNGVEKFDLIFGALVVHHLSDPQKVLGKLRQFIKRDGKIILRSSDDGGKICHPYGELLQEILLRYGALVPCDRFSGRKLFSMLSGAGYKDVKLRYHVSDTCKKGKESRQNIFNIGFGYRLNALQKMSPSPDIEWLIEAINKLKAAFESPDFWYSNTSYIAIAGV